MNNFHIFLYKTLNSFPLLPMIALILNKWKERPLQNLSLWSQSNLRNNAFHFNKYEAPNQFEIVGFDFVHKNRIARQGALHP